MYKLRKCVGETTSADVMDGLDGVALAEIDTSVDDLLATPLHLCVVSLYASEVQLGGAGTGDLATCGSSTQTNEHTGSTEDDDLRAGRYLGFHREGSTNVAQSTCDHNGFVVPANLIAILADRYALRERTEVARESRATKLIVEGAGT